jgi:hypothetical protein
MGKGQRLSSMQIGVRLFIYRTHKLAVETRVAADNQSLQQAAAKKIAVYI